MATDIFAKIGDIKGESSRRQAQGRSRSALVVLGRVPVGIGDGPGGGAGKASFADFSFMHRIDTASPLLMKACATGEHIKEATVTHRKAGKGQQEFLIIKMNDILITSVQPTAGSADGPMEAVSLQMAKVNLEYKPQKPDGSLDAGVFFKYNIKGNKEG